MRAGKLVSASPFKHPWWSPFGGMGDRARCLDEWLIVDVSNEIRAKPDWQSKYKNSDIVSKWRAEIAEQQNLSKNWEEVFDYVLRELEWYDKLESTRLAEGQFKVGPDDRIVISDNAIDKNTAKEFASEVAAFEAAEAKDYHPGSNDLVVDLVHPSLYQLVYGRTKIVENGELKVIDFDKEKVEHFKVGVTDWGVSKRFQWLPALLKMDEKSKKFAFQSYINNLHPVKYNRLYEKISDIFNQIIPGLNFSLARYISDEYVRIEIPSYTEVYGEGFKEYEERLWTIYDQDDYDVDKEQQLLEERKNYLKEFPPKWEKEPVTKDFEIRDFSNLKVVVKLANIELTPQKPKYPGGTWHVEGTINEDIVATVLYYYDMENIKDSKLAFRNGHEDPEYEQGDELYCEYYFGLKDEDKMSHFVGSVDAKKDRVVIFPNYFQHHVDSFELEDSLKPGFRKVLCFFVIDPYNDNVKSTKVVPPQQIEWAESEDIMNKYFPNISSKDINPISWEEAIKFRDELMKERSLSQDVDDFDNPYTRGFSLCEH